MMINIETNYNMEKSFRFHVRTIAYGWCVCDLYINNKVINYWASCIFEEHPIDSLLDACSTFISELNEPTYNRTEDVEDNIVYEYDIEWTDKPGVLNIHLTLDKQHKLNWDIKQDGVPVLNETIPFQDFVDGIKSESLRVLRAFGFYGYRVSLQADSDFPIGKLLKISGYDNYINKSDSNCSDITKELEYLQECLAKPIAVEAFYDRCSIYLEACQLQYSEDLFAVGERVKWPCAIANEYKNAHGFINDFEVQDNGFATHAITGTVSKIITERSEYPKGKRVVWYHKAKCIHEEITSVDRLENELVIDETTEYTLYGYIVEFTNVCVEPIEGVVEYGKL